MKKIKISKEAIIASILMAAWMIFVLWCFTLASPYIIDPMHPAETGLAPSFMAMIILGAGACKIIDIFELDKEKISIKTDTTPT